MKIEEIVRNLSLYERIIFKVHRKLFVAIYKDGVKEGFNWNRNS